MPQINDVAEKPGVLIVDDEPSARSTLEALLMPEQYQLEFAENGAEALRVLETHSLDLLLLDMMMPGMDGMELCRIIKKNRKWRHIPIILVTALDSKEDLKRGIQAGADDFLSKPVSGIELRARVRSMLRIKGQYDRLQNMLRLREELAYMIVHDMRNPLCSILGYGEFLLKNVTDAHDRSDVEKVIKEAQKINAYLSDLLLMAKMESEKLIVHREEIQVGPLVEKVIQNHHVPAEVKNVCITTSLPPDLPGFYADRNLVLKIMDNLVSNAIKYTDEGSEITIAAEAVPWNDNKEGAGVRFAIADRGPGIPEDFRDSVFEKFEIVETRKKGVRQIGLGLAFCKLAMDAHGGRIWFEPNIPKGSVFFIEF